ncbi:RHS repeat domain-containing protein [Flavobacterium oreochromis]|uniref:RHS repeat-associated core domain-containing protein n=1 Tax=Flavobacterium columnare TaxID=996 RepID=A0A246G703_9FLAO|nr:RHS repeat-associated core domain-containing protein [Flavobacterium oreochromis]OWP74027.1 hypothetical protein BWK62_15235 [Flavobacterium oreochromis]POR22586.1 hypothetical protein BWK58_10885 [Flavobacterium columnare]QYS85976.1 hypothetical protein JJC03_13170 [Flavobacterium oreochromis]
MKYYYYPFGSLIPNRHGYSKDYRYGFQGQEKDDQIKGEGNSVNYEARMQDTRVGRFLSIDPLANKFPWYSPYQFAGNTPIQAIDLDGAEEYHYTRIWVNGKPILKYTHSNDIYEYKWNPHKDTESTVGFYLWEQVKNPRKLYVVHEEREGTWEEFDKVKFVTYDETWTYTSHDNMVENKDGDYGGERYQFYAMKGLQAVSEEQRMQGGGGSTVSGSVELSKSSLRAVKSQIKSWKNTIRKFDFTSAEKKALKTATGYSRQRIVDDVAIIDQFGFYNETSHSQINLIKEAFKRHGAKSIEIRTNSVNEKMKKILESRMKSGKGIFGLKIEKNIGTGYKLSGKL